MLGHPKYKVGDIVRFNLGEDIKEGVVAIVDRFGTFFNNSDVSYDIFIVEENLFCKHFSEKYVVEKIGEMVEEEVYKAMKIL